MVPADGSSPPPRRFPNLRGVRWRIDLGVLPSTSFASIDDLRRATADSRRRYVRLRRHLLVDPHVIKDENGSSDIAMDNPLSQNPDSSWGRFFRNAELEKTLDQDLSRLYPEDGSYFQTQGCQSMLRRILLLWCLQHPEYGYRQGMHELLAPLVYVLHVDLDHLAQVRKIHKDYFHDNLDDLIAPLSEMAFDYQLIKNRKWNFVNHNGNDSRPMLDELDPDTKEMILLTDAYGAEGELGIMLSERFMEHDAYSMLDSLMDGANGVVQMADFFAPSSNGRSGSSLPPVIEASAALYHLLSVVDQSLHSHLIELGVEPQYFALRWLRVLFGREFCLNDLLVVWDQVFASPNEMLLDNDTEYSFRILCSTRGGFIAAMAVSMLLHLRSSLLATEIATSCLQKLLNFPQNSSVKKLIDKARSLQDVAVTSNTGSSFGWRKMSDFRRAHSSLIVSVSSRTAEIIVPESYWEEKWRVLHKAKTDSGDHGPDAGGGLHGVMRRSLNQKLIFSPIQFNSQTNRAESRKKDHWFNLKQTISHDSAQTADATAMGQDKIQTDVSADNEDPSLETDVPEHLSDDSDSHVSEVKSALYGTEGFNATRENSPFSAASVGDNDSQKSSITINSFEGINDDDHCDHNNATPPRQDPNSSSATANPVPGGSSQKDAAVGSVGERRLVLDKLQWLLNFGRAGSDHSNRKGVTNSGKMRANEQGSGCYNRLSVVSNGCPEDGVTLKQLAQTMLEKIQVIESVLLQDHGSLSTVVGEGQAETVGALKELRKISSLLCQL